MLNPRFLFYFLSFALRLTLLVNHALDDMISHREPLPRMRGITQGGSEVRTRGGKGEFDTQGMNRLDRE